MRLLRDILGDGTNLRRADEESLGQNSAETLLIIERGIRRRLERLGDPEVFHPIDPAPQVGFPDVEKPAATTDADVARRALKRLRLSKVVQDSSEKLDPLHRWTRQGRVPDYLKPGPKPPSGHPAQGISRNQVGPVSPNAGRPITDESRIAKDSEGRAYAELEHEKPSPTPLGEAKVVRDIVQLGDSIASRARMLRKKKE